MKFTKMHGLGNDYIYVNCFEEKVKDPQKLAPILSDRHFGIGGDGLVLIGPSDISGRPQPVKMRMFNADGSEAEMCGNALRCVAKYTYENNLVLPGPEFKIPGSMETYPHSLKFETKAGLLTVGLTVDKEDNVKNICVNMSEPVLEPKKIPVDIDKNENIVNYPLNIDGRELNMTCVSMGNPHAVFFCSELTSVDLEKIGPKIENHPLFPNRTNVHFVKVVTENEFDMVTWERGSGITLACGTGACACAVASVLTENCQRKTLAHLPGGDLNLFWSEKDNCVYMTGPAAAVFTGEIDI